MTFTSLRSISRMTRFAWETQPLERIESALVEFGPREDVLCEGREPAHVYMILDGWACGYKTLDDGRRQIISLVLPGDFCGFHIVRSGKMDHSVGTLTPVTTARFAVDSLRSQHPDSAAIERLLINICASAAIQREWTLSLGRRTAVERLGHLFCEIFTRLQAIEAVQGTSCEFPITQAELGDALGLSTVHVNRSLQELRGSGLVELKGRVLTMLDFDQLKSLAKFNPAYLSLNNGT